MFGKNTSLWTCSGVATVAATPLHVHNDVFLLNTFNNCNFS